MAAKVGEMLLFNIGEGVLRPFLIVVAADTYSGELFLDPVLDRKTEWVIRNAFYAPDKEKHTLWVTGVDEGLGVGQIRFRAQAAATSIPREKTVKPIKPIPLTIAGLKEEP